MYFVRTQLEYGYLVAVHKISIAFLSCYTGFIAQHACYYAAVTFHHKAASITERPQAPKYLAYRVLLFAKHKAHSSPPLTCCQLSKSSRLCEAKQHNAEPLPLSEMLLVAPK